MPIYFFWGEDDFALNRAIQEIKAKVVDPQWLSFNYDKISGSESTALITALNQAMSPVFATGKRLVWLVNTTIGQQCSQDIVSELERTLPQIPEDVYLIFSAQKKPDGRLKSTKLLQKLAQVRQFSLLSPWETESILNKVQQVAQELDVKLTPSATELLASSVGNHTRQLYNELEKLSLYQNSQTKPLTPEEIAPLINSTTENSLQLAAAIRLGKSAEALNLVAELINRNEPALKIVATLVSQFRTWAMVKIMLENGEEDYKIIASFAGISNPKRIYFLRQEIEGCTAKNLLATLPVLLELEHSLKRGAEPLGTFKTKIIELISCFRPPS